MTTVDNIRNSLIDKILSIVTAAIVDGLSNRGTEADIQPEASTEEVVAEVAPAVEVEVAEPTAEVEAPATEE